MRRKGYLLAVAASIFLLNGCSGAAHDNQEEAPVVQDLQIESDTSAAEDVSSDTKSDQ